MGSLLTRGNFFQLSDPSVVDKIIETVQASRKSKK